MMLKTKLLLYRFFSTDFGRFMLNALYFGVKVQNLGINSYEKDLSLESSAEASESEKTYTKTLNIEVPSFFDPGTYPVYVNLYWKNFVLFDKKELELVVRGCGSSGTPQDGGDDGEVEVQEPENQPDAAPNGDFTTVEGEPFLSSPANIAIVTGGITIFILGILFVMGYLRTRR